MPQLISTLWIGFAPGAFGYSMRTQDSGSSERESLHEQPHSSARVSRHRLPRWEGRLADIVLPKIRERLLSDPL